MYMLCIYDSFDHIHMLICAEQVINHYYHFGAGVLPYINAEMLT